MDHFGTPLTCKCTKVRYLDCVLAGLGSLVPWVRVQQKGSQNGRKSFKRTISAFGASIGGHFPDSGAGPLF